MKAIRGRIVRVEDHGSIVVTWLETSSGPRPIHPVYWDHRPFRHFAEDVGEVNGLEVEVEGDLGSQIVRLV